MSKKLKLLIFDVLFTLFQVISVFAMTEDISFFGPENRGYGSTYTLSIKRDKKALRNEYFQIEDHPSVSPSHGFFNDETAYTYTLGNKKIPLSSTLNDQIKLNYSTFAIANLTLDSYRKSCGALGIEVSPCVKLIPFYEGCKQAERNAFYRRTGRRGGEGEINFCFSQGFTPARIFDVVSHEVGHAILDALQPNYHKKMGSHPVGAFHEAFGDLSSFFASIRLASIHAVSPSSKGKRIASMIALEEEVCLAPGLSGEGTCLLRKESPDLCEDHRNSVPFRSFFLRCMNAELKRNSTLGRSEKKSAEEIVDFFQALLVHTARNVPDFESLYDLSQKMIGFIKPSPTSTLMRKELKKLRSDLERCTFCK
ncbi:MAG: hypothetical protein JSS34_05585 [Proteobacteria bacterium]|nr:hypothetical protein [Pseudomonadota bacterium]